MSSLWTLKKTDFIINHEGEVLNSKNEWRQPKIIRTTILQGGAEMAGGRVASFPEAGNTRGITMAGRRTQPCPGAGSTGNTSGARTVDLLFIYLLSLLMHNAKV